MMEKGKFLLVTSPRENEVLNELPDLERQEKLPDNKTEVFRRGLHAVRQLVEVDEKPLLRLLVSTLEESASNLNRESIGRIQALSSVVYATFIAKRGIIGAEVFESVPLTCSYLDALESGKADKKHVARTLEDLATSIKTLILRDSTSVHGTPRQITNSKTDSTNRQIQKRVTA